MMRGLLRQRSIFLCFGLLACGAVAQDADLGSGGGSYRWNDFGASGGMCMDACGPNCTPANCGEPEQLLMCHPDRPALVVDVTRYTCGTHPACSIHDDCLEDCKTAAGADFDDIDFFIADCQVKCHEDAADYAYENTGQDPIATSVVIGSWIRGRNPGDPLLVTVPVPIPIPVPIGPITVPIPFQLDAPQNTIPWTNTVIWDYSMDDPDGIERTRSCQFCEKCEDGRCRWNEDECGACNTCNDVHMSTPDGLRYDFQVAGELLLLENEEQSLVLQARFSPRGDYVTITSAVAMKVLDDRVGFYRQESLRLLVNGVEVEIADGETRSLPSGGHIERSNNRYVVRWPDDSLVMISNHSSFLNIWTRLRENHAGRVGGLLGNFDGDPGNDLFTRDGETLTVQAGRDRDFRYGQYANSWRISQAESLFDYADGESTETYQLLDFPYGNPTLDELDPATLEAAESACLAQGITVPRYFRDCIYDVAMTGDPAFALGYEDLTGPSLEVPASYLEGLPKSNIEIAAAGIVGVSSEVPVSYRGDRMPGDFLAIARVGADPTEYLASTIVSTDERAVIVAPTTEGDYSLRYIRGNEIASNLPLSVVPAHASLDSLSSIVAGGDIEVTWTGPGDAQDFIAIVDPSTPDDEQNFSRRGWVRQGNPLSITVPDEPGRYELRYIQHQSKSALASLAFDVTAASATLDAPASVAAGADIEVSWTGPGNLHDVITITEHAAPRTRVTWEYANDGSPVKLRAPAVPGDYTLNYVTAQSKTALATSPLTVTAVTAHLSVPSDVPAGSEFELNWEGPGNPQDTITITDQAPPHTRVEWKYADGGSPTILRAPPIPGEYQVNYMMAHTRTPLASEPLTVTPVTAHLQVPIEVPAGSEFELIWEGPDNPQDTITITDQAPPHKRVEWKYAHGGSPTTLRAPAIPGEYAVNYMMAQSETALATEPLTVTAVTAHLQVPSEVPAGSEFEVTWEGPDNHSDVIAIARREAAPNSYIRWKYINAGSPITFPAPEEPGEYEVRYVMGPSGHVLETRPFEVR